MSLQGKPTYPRPTSPPGGLTCPPCDRRWGIPPSQTSLPYTQLTLDQPPGDSPGPLWQALERPPRAIQPTLDTYPIPNLPYT